jgi:hypothetical protein
VPQCCSRRLDHFIAFLGDARSGGSARQDQFDEIEVTRAVIDRDHERAVKRAHLRAAASVKS